MLCAHALCPIVCFMERELQHSTCEEVHCAPFTSLCFSLNAGMVGYGMAKAAVHQLCKSLAGENSGLPSGAVAVAILP